MHVVQCLCYFLPNVKIDQEYLQSSAALVGSQCLLSLNVIIPFLRRRSPQIRLEVKGSLYSTAYALAGLLLLYICSLTLFLCLLAVNVQLINKWLEMFVFILLDGAVCRSMFAVFFLCLIISADFYKILVFSPTISRSHMISNGRIADELASAGHEVVSFPVERRTGRREGLPL